jgi:aspartyl-tRNA(Asn)/glutamyl-tRNA(Gln) amidotransferase subunit B
MNYLTTIGLEVHIQVGTKSKMFCRCSAAVFGEPPNSRVCPVCLGLPGALPVPNADAIRLSLLAGQALGSKHPEVTRFDRKNYFYPDLPKGYQISQLDLPLNIGGQVKVAGRAIRITRAHLEEDTGRLQHIGGKSFVDYNRSGLPLLEIVSDPDITSAEEARAYAQKIQQLMRYAGVSEADMEKGSFRVDANVSVRPVGQETLNSKVEVKNMNSFRAVERALKFEIDRQTQAFDAGENITQETRGWDEGKGVTFSQRSKEDSHDYRYFPEPDIPSIQISADLVSEVRSKLPEMPDEKLVRYQKEFGIKEDLSITLIADKKVAELFEQSVLEIMQLNGTPEWTRTSDLSGVPVRLGNIIRREVLTFVNQGVSLERLEPAMLAELALLLEEGRVPASSTSLIVREMLEHGLMPSKIAEEKGLTINTNGSELAELARAVLDENPKAVEEYKSGKKQILDFLIGQLMKKSYGSARPKSAETLLVQALAKQPRN